MTDTDPFDSPEWRSFEERVKADVVPKLASCAASLTLYSGDMDVKLAVELGASILLDKPLIVGVVAGAKVPDKLALFADSIIEIDLSTPEASSSTAERINQAVAAVTGDGTGR